jgi:transcriptional regulator with XRE-family HTH domain
MQDETPDIPEPEHYLRAWRRFRRLTQEQLAERVGTTGSVISELENRRKAMSLKWLHRLAIALNTKPGFIAEHDPEKLDTDVLEIFANVPDNMKDQAKRILMTFQRDGTNG